jgi:hypothetical protein
LQKSNLFSELSNVGFWQVRLVNLVSVNFCFPPILANGASGPELPFEAITNPSLRITQYGHCLSHPWRILAHPDIRKTSGVSAFFDFIGKETEALRPILTG